MRAYQARTIPTSALLFSLVALLLSRKVLPDKHFDFAVSLFAALTALILLVSCAGCIKSKARQDVDQDQHKQIGAVSAVQPAESVEKHEEDSTKQQIAAGLGKLAKSILGLWIVGDLCYGFSAPPGSVHSAQRY